VKQSSKTGAPASPPAVAGAGDPDDPPVVERHSLANALEQQRVEIARRWQEQAGPAVTAGGRPAGHQLTLAPVIADYLDAVADALRKPIPVTAGASAAWRAVSAHHELTLPARGFNLPDLVVQLITLRKVMEAILGRWHGLIGEVIDAALVPVVISYVGHRDHEARRVRSDYIGFVTHELRNPLTAAMVAGSKLDGGQQSSRAAAIVQRNLKRVARLIDDFLITEQMDADALHLDVQEIALGEILDGAVEPALRAANRPQARVSISADPAVLVAVDPALTIAALQNVILNAVQFSDKDVVTIEAEEGPERLILHVHDNCHGLSAPALATVFEPFQGGHAGKPVPGLGLSVARRIIQGEGGLIDVERANPGCHFRIVLPRAGGRQAAE
jgi:signal transduction histidine kinase